MIVMNKIPKMDQNKVFPTWQAANHLIQNIVENHVGIYITIHNGEELFQAVEVSFINPAKSVLLQMVPVEYEQKFTKILDEYTIIISNILDLEVLLKPFEGQRMTDELEEVIIDTLDEELRALKSLGVDYKAVILYMMGIRSGSSKD